MVIACLMIKELSNFPLLLIITWNALLADGHSLMCYIVVMLRQIA